MQWSKEKGHTIQWSKEKGHTIQWLKEKGQTMIYKGKRTHNDLQNNTQKTKHRTMPTH